MIDHWVIKHYRVIHATFTVVGWLGVAVFIGLQLQGSSSQSTHSAALARRVARDEQRIAGFGQAEAQQQINARYADCQQLNGIRSGLRSQVSQSKTEVPLLYQLLPQLNTPQVAELLKNAYAKELQDYRPINCTAYARRAIPRGDHHTYRIP